jgi:hypothetical protein
MDLILPKGRYSMRSKLAASKKHKPNTEGPDADIYEPHPYQFTPEELDRFSLGLPQVGGTGTQIQALEGRADQGM